MGKKPGTVPIASTVGRVLGMWGVASSQRQGCQPEREPIAMELSMAGRLSAHGEGTRIKIPTRPTHKASEAESVHSPYTLKGSGWVGEKNQQERALADCERRRVRDLVQ